MARPKEFDRDKALEKAIKIFADHGFEGASTEMLLNAMGLSRQSMYDTFGTKRDLFLQALRTYNKENADRIIQDLNRPVEPLMALECALQGFVERSRRYPNASCLSVQAICEFGLRDREIMSIGSIERSSLLGAFTRVIESGQANGSIRSNIEPSIAADFIVASLAGLRVSARSGLKDERLFDIANLIIEMLST